MSTPSPTPNKWSSALSSLDPHARPTASPPKKKALRPAATFWRREAAYVLDWMPFQMVSMVLSGLMLPSITHPEQITGATLFAPMAWSMMSVLLWAYYHIECEARFGTTLGKYAVGLRVTDADGDMLSRQHAAGRFLAAGLSWATMNIGHSLALFRKDRAMLHDMVSSSVVRHDPDVEFASWGALSDRTQNLWMMASFIIQGAMMVIFVVVMVIMVGMIMTALQSNSLVLPG